MADHRTDKCCYRSSYSDSDLYITPLQYITEIFFERTAKGALPNEFWRLPQYKKEWGRRAKEVAALLKKYIPEAIIQGLRDPRLKNLQSLHAKASFSYKKVFDEYENRLKVQEKLDVEEVKPVSGETRQPFRQSSVFDLL